MTQHVISRDGTRIAFDRLGRGPALILVVGAFNERPTGAPLAECLASRFTVFNYDRRGRGESGDTSPYAIEREIEDLDALIAAAGGSAAVFGYSSGAMLALHAAMQGSAITRLVLYEAPYSLVSDPHAADHVARLAQLVRDERRGEAVEYFQHELVGIPEQVVVQLRHAPFRPALERLAPTLVYDATLIGDRSLLSAEQVARVTVPTLALAGDASHPSMPQAAHGLAAVLPNAEARILPGQTHDLDPAALAPVLNQFLFAPIR